MALMFLTEKRDKSVKGRIVYNGKPTREWLSQEDSASPTASLESIMITGVIEANMSCHVTFPTHLFKRFYQRKSQEKI
jgi:hypothetical protein